MTLLELLKKEKTTIYEHWLAQTFQTYPKDTTIFLQKQKNRFANPVGHTISEGLREIVDILIGEKELGELSTYLEPIVKIRSIQGQRPSQALSFVQFPKKVVRDLFKDEIAKFSLTEDLEKFDERVDEMAFEAFDIYMMCRERLADIRVGEVKRMVSQVLKRTGFLEMDSRLEPANQEGGDASRPVKGGD